MPDFWQNSTISFGCVDSYAKIFLILYPRLKIPRPVLPYYLLCNVRNGKTYSSLNFDIFGLEKATNQLQTPNKASYLDFSAEIGLKTYWKLFKQRENFELWSMILINFLKWFTHHITGIGGITDARTQSPGRAGLNLLRANVGL